jgi:transposase
MVEAGHSCRAAARRFAIGDSSAIRVMQHRRKTGSLMPPRQGRPQGGGKLNDTHGRMAFVFRHRPCLAFRWRKGSHIEKR